MNNLVKQTEGIFAHASTDGIWYGSAFECRHMSVAAKEFVRSGIVKEASHIRVSGDAENAELICAFDEYMREAGSNMFVEIGRPVCRNDVGNSPSQLFWHLSELNVPLSVGGWRSLKHSDYASYDVVRKLASGHIFRDWSELRNHPAYNAVSFLTQADPHSAAVVLSDMLDPRWHFSEDAPDRYGRLRQYFGVSSGGSAGLKRAVAWLRGESAAVSTDRSRRAVDLFNLWCPDLFAIQEGYTAAYIDYSAEEFLHHFVTEKPVSSLVSFAGRVLRATHVLLRFISQVWLDALTPKRKYRTRKLPNSDVRVRRLSKAKEYTRTLFVPEHFFRCAPEVASWERHLVRGRKAL